VSIKDAFKDLVKSQGKKKALDTLTSVLSGGVDMTPDVKKKFQNKLLKKLSESKEEKKMKGANESVNEAGKSETKTFKISGEVMKNTKIYHQEFNKTPVVNYKIRGFQEPISKKMLLHIKKELGGDYILKTNAGVELHSKELRNNTWKGIKVLRMESVNEGKNIGHYERVGNQTIVDSNFVNYSKGVLPNSELVHLGMGDFAVKSPKGTIEFRRSGKLSGIGQDFVGRPHRMIDDKNGKLVDAFLKLMLKKKKAILSMSESVVNEETYFDPKGEFKKYMDKTFKRAGIKVLKFNPMKQSFHNGAWGGFYTVKSNHIGQMGATQKSDVLPIYINRVGEIELGIKAGGFHIGKAGSSQVLKNLKDFKKSDLDESYKTLTEGIKARMGEIAKQGEWEVYDPQTDKTIKVVKNSGAATRLMNRLMNSGQYEEIASRHVETHKKKFENISVTEKKGVSGSVFTIDTAKKTTELMTKVLKKVSPDIQSGQIYHSSLGGADRVSIVGKFSLDPKKTWSNNILENSRFVTFYLENDGTLEVNVNGYPSSMRGKVKMRKSANNDIKQVLSRMVTHFSMLNKKYPEGN
jgi:hypothetical protein